MIGSVMDFKIGLAVGTSASGVHYCAGTPSTKISRLFNAMGRNWSASAYSADAYQARARSIVGNSTMTMR